MCFQSKTWLSKATILSKCLFRKKKYRKKEAKKDFHKDDVCPKILSSLKLNAKIPKLCFGIFNVRKEGLEPTRLSAPDPKSGAATNYATSAGIAKIENLPFCRKLLEIGRCMKQTAPVPGE